MWSGREQPIGDEPVATDVVTGHRASWATTGGIEDPSSNQPPPCLSRGAAFPTDEPGELAALVRR